MRILMLLFCVFMSAGILHAVERYQVNRTTSLRTGPGPQFSSTGLLRRGMIVMPSGTAAADGWIKVRTADAESGWVQAGALNSALPGSNAEPIRRLPAPDFEYRSARMVPADGAATRTILLPPRVVSEPDRMLQLVFPVAGGRISSSYGPRLDPFTGLSAFHHGIDIAAPAGTPIQALGEGKVTFSGSLGGFGRLVVIDHGRDCRTYYAHMQSTDLHTGDSVGRGEVIGTVGSTGRATGPHLHLEVRRQGQRLPPRLPSARLRPQSFSIGGLHERAQENPCEF